MTPDYIHIPAGALPPVIVTEPFKAIIVVNDDVSDDWRASISAWLVGSGCRYMMAWGRDCSLWDDSVDWAALDFFGYDPVPDDKFVMTTWHDDEPLTEVFWFSECCAHHPTLELRTIIIDISPTPRGDALSRLFETARQQDKLL